MSEKIDSGTDEDEAKLLALFQKLGSSEEQAKRMVPQLTKRAQQMSVDGEMSYLAALGYLIRLTISGRSGETDIERPTKNL